MSDTHKQVQLVLIDKARVYRLPWRADPVRFHPHERTIFVLGTRRLCVRLRGSQQQRGVTYIVASQSGPARTMRASGRASSGVIAGRDERGISPSSHPLPPFLFPVFPPPLCVWFLCRLDVSHCCCCCVFVDTYDKTPLSPDHLNTSCPVCARVRSWPWLEPGSGIIAGTSEKLI